MMHIVELRQGDVADFFKSWQLENDYFSGRTAIKDVANHGGTLEDHGRVWSGARFQRTLVFHACSYLAGFRIDFEDQRGFVQVLFLFVLKNQLALPRAKYV